MTGNAVAGADRTDRHARFQHVNPQPEDTSVPDRLRGESLKIVHLIVRKASP
jgi:hypothetical protein